MTRGIGLRQFCQFDHGRRRRSQPGAIGEEGKLSHAPGTFQSFRGFGEVEARCGLACGIDQGKVRQRLGKGTKEQPILLHRAEVLAVDPDEIDRTLGGSGTHLVADTAHHLGRIADLDVDQPHVMA